MAKPLRLSIVALLVGLLALAAVPHPAAAHPLGNFTINHYTALTVESAAVRVHYVLDMAEIPTFQELGDIRPDHSSDLTPAERSAYLARKTQELLPSLLLTLDNKPLTLKPVGEAALSFPPGAGGLSTMRLVLDFSAALPASHGTLVYQDNTFAARTGWREIIANGSTGVALTQSSVPATDHSQALTVYPQDLLASPLQVSEATVQFAPGSGPSGATVASTAANAGGLTGWIQQRTDAMTDLMARKDLPLDVVLFGLVIAFFLGAAHALSPGHGKTIAAAYLVGSRGTARHAIILGLTVTITHTIGVFLFGLVVLFAAQFIVPEQLYPWLGFASGMMVVVIGLALFVQRSRPFWAAWRARAAQAAHAQSHALGLGHAHGPEAVLVTAGPLGPDRALAQTQFYPLASGGAGQVHTHEDGPAQDHAHDHDHDHDHSHDHDHAHEHDHGHSHDAHSHDQAHSHGDAVQHHADGRHSHGPFGTLHSHLPPDGQGVTLKSLLALGISGGILPCPSALVVLLSAIAFHRVGIGLVLIIVFSAGLAMVLTAIGLLMVYARRLMSRIPFEGRLMAPLGMVSALFIAGTGLAIAFGALANGVVLRF